MNTLSNLQVFSPIPFHYYNHKVTNFNTLEISKNSGHFDYEEYTYISFYGRDYVSGNTQKIKS